MFRFLFYLALIIGFIWFGSTVKLGDKTLFDHVRAIWHSPETQDLKRGVEETAAPAVHKLEHGAEAGYRAITGSDDAGVGSASAR